MFSMIAGRFRFVNLLLLNLMTEKFHFTLTRRNTKKLKVKLKVVPGPRQMKRARVHDDGS